VVVMVTCLSGDHAIARVSTSTGVVKIFRMSTSTGEQQVGAATVLVSTTSFM